MDSAALRALMWAACVSTFVTCVQESVELRPMYGADGADDAAAASDSGGASFLGQLWHAVQVGAGALL